MNDLTLKHLKFKIKFNVFMSTQNLFLFQRNQIPKDKKKRQKFNPLKCKYKPKFRLYVGKIVLASLKN